MLEGTTNRERIITAALRLAETRGWRDLSLGEIAAEAGVPLVEFRKEFQSKGQILAAFSRAVDLAVIERFPAPGPDVARDRLFDVLLTRFEVMQPYKAAIRCIREDAGSSLGEFARADAARAEIAILDAGRGRHQRRGRHGLRAGAGASVDLFSRLLDLARGRRPRHGPHHGRLGPALAAGESVMRGIERFRDELESLTRSLRVTRMRVKDEPQSEAPAAEPDAPPAAQQPI